MFVPVIEGEVKRQEENIASGKAKSEVRNAKEDGTSEFLRPMPGSARMYPETDLPLLRISRNMIDEARRTLPRLRSEIRGELRQKGLSEEMLKLLDAENLADFESMLKIINDSNFVAKTLLLIPKEIAAHEQIENIEKILTADIISAVLNAVAAGKIGREDVKQVMEEIVRGKSFEQAIEIEKADLGEIESEIAKIVKEKPGLSIGGYMGLIMAKFKGKVSGKDATQILNKLLR
jgi:glutamyl-tRNA(Gln) amidotransferase subunit E